jgi:NADH-quinone oxidoreductase subunit N
MDRIEPAAGDIDAMDIDAMDMGSMDMGALVGDVAPEIALVLGGIAVLLFALFAPRRLQSWAAAIAAATCCVSAVLAWVALDTPQQLTFTDSYAIDAVTSWARLIVVAATLATIALSAAWFRSDPRQGEYYTLLLFSSLGAILLAGATDLIQLILALLLSSVTGYVLVAYHRLSRVAAEAGIKYFLLGALPNAGMLIGVAYLFGLAGGTTYPVLAAGLVEASPALVAGVALVVVALSFKIGAVPAHAWVPDVAQGAPAPVAAFVTAVPKIGGLIALARFVSVLPAESVGWRPVIAVLAAVTMTLGNLAALWQDDVRRLLGWSSVSQTGYGLLAVVALGRSELAVPSLLFFLLAYAAGNVAAFGVVVELRGRTRLADYAGLARARPWLAGALTLAFLSFIGVPPLAGFFAKFALFGAAMEAGYGWLAVVAAVNTVVSIVYYVRVLAPAYFGAAVAPVPVLGRWAAVATLATASGVVVVGLAAEPFVRAFARVTLLPG